MSGTIIEQLTTKLGLDVTDFKKGIGEAKKSMDELKGSGESAGEAIGGMIGGGAKRATGGLGMLGSVLGKGGAVGVGIGAAIYLGKKLDDTLFKVALSVRQVSIESKNLNKSAADLRNLQNASAMAGGSIEDAAQTVGNLQKSLFNLRFNGQVSDQIVMLSRLGVQFQDSYGRARDFNDVMLDTASALEKAQSSGQMSRGEASEFAEQAGFTGGMQQLVLSGRSGVEAELAKQLARTQINGKMTGAADHWVRASLSMGQSVESEVGNKAMGLVGDTRAIADEKLEKSGQFLLEGAGKAIDFLGDAAQQAGEKLINLAINAGLLAPIPGDPKFGGSPGKSASGEAAWAPTIAAMEKKHGIPTGVLAGLIATESNFDPSAVNPKTGAKGLAQFMPATAREMGITAGADPAADIDAAGRYLRKLHDQAASSGMAEGDVMPWVVATSAYHDGMGNVQSGRNIGPESLAYPGKVLRDTQYADAAGSWANTRPGGGGHTEIHIDNINVQTQATDADGIAAAIGPATQRKLLAAQAEQGIQ